MSNQEHNLFPCPECGRVCKSKIGLISHRRAKHPKPKKPPIVSWQCNRCGARLGDIVIENGTRTLQIKQGDSRYWVGLTDGRCSAVCGSCAALNVWDSRVDGPIRADAETLTTGTI